MNNYMKAQTPSRGFIVFFNTVYIILGLDFGTFRCKSAKVKVTLNCLSYMRSFLLCLYITYAVCTQSPRINLVWYLVQLSLYMISVTVLFFIPEANSLCQFQSDLSTMSLKLRANNAEKIFRKKVISGLSTILVYRLLLHVLYCTFYPLCVEHIKVAIAFVFIMYSHDLLLITNFFVYYALGDRLDLFVSNLQHAASCGSLVQYHKLYKSIADVTDRTKKTFDPLFLLSMLFHTPRVMVSIYQSIKYIKELHEYSLWTIVSVLIDHANILFNFLLTVTPALSLGRLASRAEKVKCVLHEKLLQVQDESTRLVIEKFISYVEARPLKYKLYSVLPLDATLLHCILHFGITYLIVIIQLSHLY